MKGHHLPIGKNDEWLTPPEMLIALGGDFDLDPCAPASRPWATAKVHIALPDDGLAARWEGRVWLNPPFNRYLRPRWMKRMAEHGNGIMLIPAATETEAFDLYVWRAASAVCFVKKRPHYHYVNGSRAKCNSGTAMILAAYGAQNIEKLEKSHLGKTLVLTSPLKT